MDLPTYTNIWRIEKRLYKLYDFRLPAPLPITWIGVFTAITVPYVIFLIAVGLPFNHTLVWLYVLPPGVLTWLCTRPVIESKRLPELVSSQLRYIAEPRTWCRMAPFAEKDEILVSARVWHLHPPKARPKKAKRSTAKAQSVAPALQVPAADLQVPAEESPQALVQPVAGQPVALPLASAQQAASPPVVSPSTGPTAPPASAHVPVPERAPAHRTPKRAKPQLNAEPSWSPWPRRSEPDTAATGSAAEPGPESRQRPAWLISPHPSSGAPDVRALEVAHDSDPGGRGLSEPHAPFVPASWPSPDASLLPLLRPTPEPSPFPEAGPFPEIGPFPEAGPFPEPSPVPEPGAGHGPEPATSPEPGAGTGPAASTETGAPPRWEPASGPARRLRSGLVAGLGRLPGRAAWLRRSCFAAGGLAGRGWLPGNTRLASGARAAAQAPGALDAPCSVPSRRRSRTGPARADRAATCRAATCRAAVTGTRLPGTGAVRVRFGTRRYRRACRSRYPRADSTRAVHARPVGCCALASRVSAAAAGIRTRAARFTRSGRRRARGIRCARPRDWHPRDWHPRDWHPRRRDACTRSRRA